MPAKDIIRIGLGPCFFHADSKRPIFKGKTLLYLEQSLAQWLISKNILVYLLPSVGQPEFFNSYLNDLDGLVLQGGSDVSPKSYGERALKEEWQGDYVRDQCEIRLIKAFIAAKKPILGVCRGLQILNVALGGTLYQDIQTQNKTAIIHRNWEIYDQLFHEIEFTQHSKLAHLYNPKKTGRVNSVHHQAIKDLADNLVVEATSRGDGLIEAVRLNSDDQYVVAVQWHPEFQDPNDKALLGTEPLLNDFVNALLHNAQ